MSQWDIDLRLEIEPVPAARPRVTRQGWSYYPKKYKDFKALLASMFLKIASLKPLPNPCTVDVEVVASRPKSTKLVMPKPDVDNYFKAVTDAATGKVWDDDWQIRSGTASKRWTEKGEAAHIRLKVKWE